jgi:hypothetical protein
MSLSATNVDMLFVKNSGIVVAVAINVVAIIKAYNKFSFVQQKNIFIPATS